MVVSRLSPTLWQLLSNYVHYAVWSRHFSFGFHTTVFLNLALLCVFVRPVARRMQGVHHNLLVVLAPLDYEI